MDKYAKYIFIAGAASLLLVFVAPIWRITLEAPQYPTGITLYIWVDKLSGDEPGTLQNINILNHYVGMKMIEPDSIPELKYFKYIIIIISGLGIILGFTGNRKLWLAWAILLILLGALGIYDFYLWEYDYGHNLSDEAPIKVPGMAYQPPLIGEKMLLNFNAISYPHIGSIFIALPIFCGFFTYWLKRKS